MRKPIAILKDDPELARLDAELDAMKLVAQEKMAFIEKQVQDLEKSFQLQKRPVWDKIVERLKAQERVPQDYDTDKYNLCSSDGVVYLMDKEEDSTLQKLIEGLKGLTH